MIYIFAEETSKKSQINPKYHDQDHTIRKWQINIKIHHDKFLESICHAASRQIYCLIEFNLFNLGVVSKGGHPIISSEMPLIQSLFLTLILFLFFFLSWYMKRYKLMVYNVAFQYMYTLGNTQIKHSYAFTYLSFLCGEKIQNFFLVS